MDLGITRKLTLPDRRLFLHKSSFSGQWQTEVVADYTNHQAKSISPSKTDAAIESRPQVLRRKIPEIPGINRKQCRDTKTTFKKTAEMIYKPHTIQVSGRAKITLYSQFSLTERPMLTKRRAVVVKPAKNSSKVEEESSIMEQESLPKFVDAGLPALTFREKLYRLNEIVCDPGL